MKVRIIGQYISPKGRIYEPWWKNRIGDIVDVEKYLTDDKCSVWYDKGMYIVIGDNKLKLIHPNNFEVLREEKLRRILCQ